MHVTRSKGYTPRSTMTETHNHFATIKAAAAHMSTQVGLCAHKHSPYCYVHRRLSDNYSTIGEKREKRKTEVQAFLQAVDEVLEAEGLFDERAHVRLGVLELL
jgi:hypothetical protein